MDESIKELVAIGASVGAHCQPCLEYHIQAALALGIDPEDIRQAIAVGHEVEKGSMTAMRRFSAQALEYLVSSLPEKPFAENKPGVEEQAAMKTLKIYDPAMCCSSGVCGPKVDPVLAKFSGALQFLALQKSVKIERYNLAQQPQAFVENQQVKNLLSVDGGEKKLPFIFIDDKLAFHANYPSRSELLQTLGVKDEGSKSPNLEPSSNDPCCAGGKCC
jgi:AhpD family alkylhydroperoxidase